LFAIGLAVFVLLALTSVAVNGFFDRYVPNRSSLGEMLAIGGLCLPMGFAIVIPLTNLDKSKTLMCLRILIGLAALTGVVMAAFAVFPQVVAGMLGWVKDLGADTGLVRGTTPLGHSNTVSAVLLLLLPVAILLGFTHRSVLWTPFYLGSALCLMAGILFSLSRASAAVAAVIILLCYLYLFVMKSVRRGFLVGTAALFAICVAAVGIWLFATFDFGRFWSRRYFEAASVERRIQTMNTALVVIRDYPVFGISPNSLYPRDDVDPHWIPPDVDLISTIVYYRGHLSAASPHNLYLMVLAEYGVFGAAVFFSLLALCLLALLYAWRALRHFPPEDRATMASAILALIGFLGVGMSGVLFIYSVRIGLVFWVFVGLALRYAIAAWEGNRERVNAG
jgi:O-antigen ligase